MTMDESRQTSDDEPVPGDVERVEASCPDEFTAADAVSALPAISELVAGSSGEAAAALPIEVAPPPFGLDVAGEERPGAWHRAGRELISAVQTLFSAAVYATLIVTF